MQIGKEELKLSLFADEMIVFVENLKESGFGELPGWWTHPCTSRVCTPTLWGQKILCLGPSQTSPYESLHLAVQVHPLSSPLINWKTSMAITSFVCTRKSLQMWIEYLEEPLRWEESQTILTHRSLLLPTHKGRGPAHWGLPFKSLPPDPVFQTSLEATLLPLSLGLNPSCESFPVSNYVGLSCLTRASFSGEGLLVSLTCPPQDPQSDIFIWQTTCILSQIIANRSSKFGANQSTIPLWWDAHIDRKPQTSLCYVDKTPLSPALTFRKNKREKLSKWEHT